MVVDARKLKPEKRMVLNGVKRFTEWKQLAIDKILADDELMKLMVYNTPDWKNRPQVPMENRYDLVEKQIYTYGYVDDIAERKTSYITMSMSHFRPQEGFRQFSDDYIQGLFYMYILTDRAIRTTNVGDRADLILARLYDLFQGTRFFGIGELRMETLIEIWADNNSHGGYTLGFEVVEMK